MRRRWQLLWPSDDAPGVLRVREVIAAGQIDAGKTIGSLRDAVLPGVIAQRLQTWRTLAGRHGLPNGRRTSSSPVARRSAAIGIPADT